MEKRHVLRSYRSRVLLAVLAAVLMATPGAGEQSWTILTAVELLEGPSVNEEPIAVHSTEKQRLGPGEEITLTYVDPADSHQYELAVALRPSRAEGQEVDLQVVWRDQTADRVRERFEPLTVDGSFSLKLYEKPDSGTKVYLRLSPRIER